MNTKDTPFALSFGNYGDPRRYMNGQPPAKKIEQAAAKIKNSPLANIFGLALAGGGEQKTMPPSVPALGQGIGAPSAPSVGIKPNAPSGVGIPAGSFQIPNLVLPQISDFNAAPQATDADNDGQIDDFWGVKTLNSPQPAIGPQSSAVDVKNETDFNPLAPDTSNQFAVSGNDYRQVPSYGKLQKIASAIFGQG